MKGQTGIDYLVNYGWVVLAIVFVACILWWLGVFNYSNRAQIEVCPSECPQKLIGTVTIPLNGTYVIQTCDFGPCEVCGLKVDYITETQTISICDKPVCSCKTIIVEINGSTGRLK